MTILERDLDGALAVVAEHAAAQAEARRLDDAVAAAVASTGLNRSLAPAELGGDERHPNGVVDDIVRIAAVDGSTGWCAAIGVGANVFAGYVPEAVARRDFTDLDASGAGMFAPAGVVKVDAEGRATLTGRWPFTSNCVHGRWIGLGAFVERADGERDPFPRLVIVPHDDVTIEDTWFGDGLRATGSHHVRTEGVAVDLDRSCTFADRSWAAGPLWRMPLFTVLAPLLGGAVLGIARGAVDALLARVVPGEGGTMRGALQDDPVGMAELGAADAALRAAYAGVRAAVDEVWQQALEGERSGGVLQARVALAVHHAADVAVESTSVAHRLWGGGAAYLGNRALEALRDVHAARQHVLFAHQHRPALARIAAGSPEVAPPFVL